MSKANYNGFFRETQMKFSLFFEMQISQPTRRSEAELFHQSVEQAILAESLGYHGVWAVEHHGLYEYSHSSAPEIFLAFVAARTQRLRIGHGVTLLPYRYNHPIRVAERIATLDILSGGRVNWGSGKSGSRTEQCAFECDVDTLHQQWLEAIEIIPRMWTSDVFSFRGKFFDIPPMTVIPHPVQQPHPPMFAACTRPESAGYVGSLGLGALNFALGTDEFLAENVRAYHQASDLAQPIGRSPTRHFACTPATLVLADDRAACAAGMRGARFFRESLYYYYNESGTSQASASNQIEPVVVEATSSPQPTVKPQGVRALALGGLRRNATAAAEEGSRLKSIPVSRGPIDEADLSAAMRNRNKPGSQNVAILGDPVAARESVQRFVDSGVDELILMMQLGTVPHELVMESIRTFGEEVLPYF